MSALSEAKKAVTPGTTWTVTNHYINNALADNDGFPRLDRSGERHGSYGPNGHRRTITRVTGSRFYYEAEDRRGGEGYIEWPKAAQVQRDPDGTVRLYGGGGGQCPTDLFITLVPVTT